uniref:Methyltransf_21 domain-containing protein n=2 Tax=Caenorhabditis tropicalis TaxID=1561998 RepID=A0A1I7U3V5_9PELO
MRHLLLFFALLGLVYSTIYWKNDDPKDMADPVIVATHQIHEIYAAYWDRKIIRLFQLMRYGTPMSRFIEEHAADEITVHVQEADYFFVDTEHGIKAIIILEDVSQNSTDYDLVKMSMSQSASSPTGYTVFGWEKCENLECD